MEKKINAVYFSATDTTRKVVEGIAEKIAQDIKVGAEISKFDFTLPHNREQALTFTEEDVVVLGTPVIAGRVPNVLLKYLNSIRGNGALAIAVVVYGNRNYDDALIELKDILELDGFKVIAAGAFIGEHSFSKILAKNRPDEKDMAIVASFGDQIYEKIETNNYIEDIIVNGNKPYRKYYMPKDKEGIPVDIRKVTPKTNSLCTDCKLCVKVCPMGSINYDDVSKLDGICIKCGACVKKCPTNAKYYDDQDYLRHKIELEIEFADRREIELFI